MKSSNPLFSATALFVMAGLLGASSAKAATVTDVTIPYNTGLYTNWSGAVNGAQMAAAPTNGNTGTGITFANWSGQFNEVDPQNSTTFSIPNVALGSTSTVNTLFNTFYGISGINATITFTNSNSDTAVFDLVGDDTIRDYNQNSYQNALAGGSVLGGVTAQNWWNNAGNGQRLDVQTFYLPSAWAGTDLVSMTVANNTPCCSNPNPDDVLSALQVVSNASTSPVPEPSSITLLGTGIIGIAGTLRRRFKTA